MILHTKQTDERRDAGPAECWCLHGAVGSAADWRGFSKQLAQHRTSTRAVDLWRFLECQPSSLVGFARDLNAEAAGSVTHGHHRSLIGYSMGGRLALHALLAPNPPWQSAVIISSHPGLESPQEQQSRLASDAAWASKALVGSWNDFLREWQEQPVLTGHGIRDDRQSGALQLRRREIARSFVDWSLGSQQPLWDRLHEIQIPILWIAGEQDAKFLRIAERATALIPHATLAIAPHAGHRVPWDAPDWFGDRVATFLQTGK